MKDPERHTDLMRQGFMRRVKEKKVKQRKITVACDLCFDWHEEGKHRRVVWSLEEDGKSLSEAAPRLTLKEAEKLAELRAATGLQDQVVTYGHNLNHKQFKILQRYKAETGHRVW